MSGTVEAIHIASGRGEKTFAVESVAALERLGLEGDRLVNRARSRAGAGGRATVVPRHQVTLIEAEALEAMARDHGVKLTAAESRRNILTRGVALNHLVGREFRVGEAGLRGLERCEPCGTLERLSGRRGVVRGLIHRGGLRAEVLTGGLIRRGDAIVAAHRSSPSTR